MKLLMIIFLIVALIILVGIAIFLIYHFRQKKYDDFILKNSVSLNQLKEINSRYTFKPYKDLNQTHTYDNERYYNNISCQDYLIYQLQFKRKDVYEQINNINSNAINYSNYISEIKAITQCGSYYSYIGNLNLDKIVKREKLLFEKQIYRAPTTQFLLTVTLYCAKINGQIYARKYENFSAEEVLALIKRLNRKRGTYYTDREMWDAICRVERGKVSNKMRFSIYARDGYRCRNCGLSNRYAQLEIDHIIPIAKGGKTTFDNLQTLCHRYNVEKGDSLY